MNTLLNNEIYIGANLDAPDNAFSGIEPSSEILKNQSQKLNWAKHAMPKSLDLSKSLEIKPI